MRHADLHLPGTWLLFLRSLWPCLLRRPNLAGMHSRALGSRWNVFRVDRLARHLQPSSIDGAHYTCPPPSLQWTSVCATGPDVTKTGATVSFTVGTSGQDITPPTNAPIKWVSTRRREMHHSPPSSCPNWMPFNSITKPTPCFTSQLHGHVAGHGQPGGQ